MGNSNTRIDFRAVQGNLQPQCGWIGNGWIRNPGRLAWRGPAQPPATFPIIAFGIPAMEEASMPLFPGSRNNLSFSFICAYSSGMQT
jgi:hypothetical protein